MEEKQIDGLTGELIGNYVQGATQGYTYTTTTVPASNTYTTTVPATSTYTTTTTAPAVAYTNQTYVAPVQYTTGTTYTTGGAYTTGATGAYHTGATGAYTGGYTSGGTYTVPAATTYATSTYQAPTYQSSTVVGGVSSNVVVNTGKEVIKGESRIEYVPFEKKIIEYKDQAKV